MRRQSNAPRKPHLGFRERLPKPALIATTITVGVIVIGSFLWYLWRPKEQPTIVEAPAPGVSLRYPVLFADGDGYGLYFSLHDAEGKDIARGGDVHLKIIEIGTISVQGGPSFINEILLLDATFEVNLSTYRWLEIEGGLFFSKRRLIIPKKIPGDALKRVPAKGGRAKIEIEFQDKKVPSAKVPTEKLLRWPG